MTPNAKLSDQMAIMATLNPASVAASTVTTGWVSVGKHASLIALLQTGVLGAAATVDAKIQQATDAAGTGAKDVTGKAIVQIVKASGDDKQATISFKPEDLDVANNFSFVRLSVTVGAAASILSAALLGAFARYTDSLGNQAGVVQSV